MLMRMSSRHCSRLRLRSNCGGRQQRRRQSSSSSSSSSSEWSNDSFKKARHAFFNTETIWRPIPVSLGIAFIASIHLWRLKQAADDDAERRRMMGLEVNDDLKVDGPFQMRLYAALPLREISRLWGTVNSLTVPVGLRSILYGTYSKLFRCNLEEMRINDLQLFPNLGEFFYRELKEGARPIDTKALVVSPSDGRVLSFGEIQERQVESVKGVTYSLDALLGRPEVRSRQLEELSPSQGKSSATWPSWFFGGGGDKGPSIFDPSGKLSPRPGNALYYCVIYLAPGDYHRFHSPVDWSLQTLRHFCGELLSVSPRIVASIRNLFVLNERVALTGTWAHGFFSMIPVGATNVGSIKINLDPELRTNQPLDARGGEMQFHPLGTFTERHFGTRGVTLHRGDEVGGFRLGSTVVLVFEAPKAVPSKGFALEIGQKVSMGQGIFF